MLVVGAIVEVRNARPACSVVVVDDSTGTPVIESHFVLTSSPEALALQVRALHASVVSNLQSLSAVQRVYVRRADWRPGSMTEGQKLRLVAEGAIVAAACEVVPDTDLRSGSDLGRLRGSDRDAVDAEGAALVASYAPGGSVASRALLAKAAAAALAALTAP